MVAEDGREALERATSELERLARREGRPDRYLARELLIALGRALTTAPARADEARARIEKAGERLGRAWREACRSELDLACAEHIHAVDPRYLDLPNYDFAYTLAARERLEARLTAARSLGLGVSEALLKAVRQADELLEPHRRAGSSPPAPGAEEAGETDGEPG